MKVLTQPRFGQRSGKEITVVGRRRETSRNGRLDAHAISLVIATIASIAVALLSNASPAGIPFVDAVYRSTLAFLVVWFAARARRWTWTLIAGLAVASASSLVLQIVSVAALGAAGWSVLTGQRRRWVGAVVAGLSIVALLLQGQGPLWRLTFGRIEDPFGTSAILTCLAIGPVFISGWKTLSKKQRGRSKIWARQAAVIFAGIILVTGAVCALAISPLTSGLEQTQLAADLAANGDLEAASIAFEEANHEWDTANSRLSGPWMIPSRVVPILGQHVRAAQVVSGQASAITDSATTVTRRVDPDSLVQDARINIRETDAITPVIDAFAATVDRAALRVAEVNSPWLVAPVGSRMDRSVEILTPASGVVGAAAEALHVVNDLLGGPTPSQILVMFSTPAEARGSGGFIGNWAVVTGDQGSISISEQYRTRELNALLEAEGASLPNSPEFATRYGQFNIERHIQDVTISPDFPTVAAVTSNLFAQATGTSVEAVVMVDPLVVQQLLQFSGPISTSGDSAQLTSANVLDELFVGQYERFDEDEGSREAELSALVTTLLTQLLDDPPDPQAFATELAPLAEQDRMAMWWRSDTDGEAMQRLGLDGAFPTSEGDLLAVVHQNSGQNKIDSFLTRTMEIQTTLDVTEGRVDHEVTLTLENQAPTSGLPDAIIGSNDQGIAPGTNAMLLTLYSELPVLSASFGETAAPFLGSTEFGVHATTFILSIPSEDSLVLDLSLGGDLDLATGYEVVLGAQPLVSPDRATWNIRTVEGARITPSSSEWSSDGVALTWNATVEHDRDFAFSFGN